VPPEKQCGPVLVTVPVVGSNAAGGVGTVAVGRRAMAAGTEVVVRIRVIHRHRPVRIDRRVFVDRMPPRGRFPSRHGSEDIFAGDKRVLMVSTFERGYIPTTARCRLGPI